MKKYYFILISAAFVFAFVQTADAKMCKPKKNILDFVNIGDTSSESGHDLEGWGPVEPDTHGGNWGNIARESDCDLASSSDCDKKTRVTYASDEPDHPETIGRAASVTLSPGKRWGLVSSVKMRVLDGAANDDFLVFVKDKRGRDVLVGTIVSDPDTTEVWKVHEFKLLPKFWLTSRPLEVTVMSTGSDWKLKNTYGQLAVDWISLSGFGICCGCAGDLD